MKTKNTLIMAMLLMFALLASACSGSGGETKEPVNIRILLPFPEVVKAENQIFEAAAQNFKKLNPNITITVVAQPGDRFLSEQDLKDRLNSNEPPDIIPFLPSSYNQNDVMTDLTNMPNFNEIDIDEQLLSIVNDGKELVWLPFSFDVNALIYNKKMFDLAEIPYPEGDWTWEQYRDVSLKMNSAGVQTVPALSYDLFTLGTLLASSGKDIVSPDGETYVGYLDSPETVDTVKWLNNIYKEVNANKEPIPINWIGAWENFTSSKTAMFVGNYNSYSALKYNFKYDGFAAAPLPHFEGSSPSNKVINSYKFGIVKTSKHRQEAWQFLKYLFFTNNESTGDLANYYLSPSKSISETNGQRSDPDKAVFMEGLTHANGYANYPPMDEETSERFNSLLTADDDSLSKILHQIAEKLDQELARIEWDKERQSESP